jgi:hypothetical protein
MTPVQTINTAPSKAAAGRFNGRIFSCRPLISTYVIAKMTVATTSLCQ